MLNIIAENRFFNKTIILLFTILITLSAQPDSSTKMITIVPSERYAAGLIHKFFLGYGYREVWTTPVQVPELNLDTYAGGLKPIRQGGAADQFTAFARSKRSDLCVSLGG